jgi:hypothetical protein
MKWIKIAKNIIHTDYETSRSLVANYTIHLDQRFSKKYIGICNVQEIGFK